MKRLVSLVISFTLTVMVAFSQGRTVTGTVTDAADGAPLPLVNILIKGTQRGTVTDNAGRYTLQVPDGESVLVFLYTGYASREETVGGRTEINVALREANEEIAQVVVTGYQKIEKKRSTGSYAIFGRKDLAQANVRSLDGPLEGLTAGVTYNSVTKKLQVRGVTSLMANASPLLVLDGLPYEGALEQINPATVRSVTVLRDAAAASIYGARAANGVIVIETESGEGAIQVMYDGMVQLKPRANLSGLNLMSSEEYVDYMDWLYRTYGDGRLEKKKGYYMNDLPRRWVERFRDNTITDAQYGTTLDSLRGLSNRDQAQSLLERLGVYHSHSVMVSGGDKYRFAGALRYEQEFPNDRRTRNQSFSLSLMNSSTFNHYVSMNVGMRARLGRTRTFEGLSAADDFYRSYAPYQMLYGAEGEALQFYRDRDEWGIENLERNGLPAERFVPAEDLWRSYAKGTSRWGRGLLTLTFTPVQPLRVEASGAMEYGWDRARRIDEKDAYGMVKLYNDGSELKPDGAHAFPRGGRLRQTLSETFSYTLRLQANWDQQFGVHRVTALLGSEIRERKDRISGSELLGYDPQTLAVALVNEAELSNGVTGTAKLNKQAFIYNLSRYELEPLERFCSFYTTGSYSLLQRYNITGSVRVDQSNLWGTSHEVQWKPLWSVGASWQISEEDFARNARGWLDRLVLRGSYGISGNVPRGAYPVLVVSPGLNSWMASLSTLTVESAPNPKLRWEKTRTTNVGLDWNLFGNRFTGTLEWYYRMTTDLLGRRPADPTLGWHEVLVNYGKMLNTGVELTILGELLHRGDFRLNSNLVFSYNRSKLLSVRGVGESVVSRVMGPVAVEGYPFGSLFSYRFAGLSPVNGAPQVHLHRGSVGKKAESLEDLTYSGTVIPQYTGNFALTFGWKGFDLTAGILYYGGHVMRRPVSMYYSWLGGAVGYDRDYLHVWKRPGDEELAETVPAPSTESGIDQAEQYAWSAADKHILRADYLKLNVVVLSYTFPEQWLTPAKIAGLQLIFQVDNIANIPFNRAGIDPEMVGAGVASGVRLRKVPPFYTFSLRMNI